MGHNGVEALNLRADTNTWMLKQKFIQEGLGYPNNCLIVFSAVIGRIPCVHIWDALIG